MVLLFFTYGLALSQLSKLVPLLLSFPAHSLLLGHLTDFFKKIPEDLLPCLHDQAKATVSVDSVATSVPAGDGQSFHSLHMVQPESSLFCGHSE